MPEKDTIFSSKIKFTGVFSFADFYQFCYKWLTDQEELTISEDSYSEKITGDTKNLTIKWTCSRKITDYFKYEIKIVYLIMSMASIEVVQNGAKVKTNRGYIEVGVKGTLVRDYEGKFEKRAFQKFMRGIYEKWIIVSRVKEYEDKLVGVCDDFLNQAKAWLDLEGKK